MQYVVLLGRILYSAIFIMAAMGHFTVAAIDYATSHGVPMANFLVPLWGLFGLVGGLSVLLGYRARYGAWLLVIFLLPVTLMMHSFWSVSDPMMANLQRIMFMKNLALIGAALIIAYFGTGPMSLSKKK